MVPEELIGEGSEEHMMQWGVDNGIDVGISITPTSDHVNIGSIAPLFSEVPRGQWEDLLAKELVNKLAPIRSSAELGLTNKSVSQLPATYIFKTREGGMGILQITSFTENPKGVKIRYKMLQSAQPSSP